MGNVMISLQELRVIFKLRLLVSSDKIPIWIAVEIQGRNLFIQPFDKYSLSLICQAIF